MHCKDYLSTLSVKRNTAIATDNEIQAGTGNTDAKNGFVVMDVSILHQGRVKTLDPVTAIGRDTKIIHISNLASERNYKEKERPFWLQKFPLLHRPADAIATPGFHKKMRDVAIIIVIGILVGLTAALLASSSTNKTENSIILDRLDRLIRAVEMDWGR